MLGLEEQAAASESMRMVMCVGDYRLRSEISPLTSLQFLRISESRCSWTNFCCYIFTAVRQHISSWDMLIKSDTLSQSWSSWQSEFHAPKQFLSAHYSAKLLRVSSWLYSSRLAAVGQHEVDVPTIPNTSFSACLQSDLLSAAGRPCCTWQLWRNMQLTYLSCPTCHTAVNQIYFGFILSLKWLLI